MRTAVLLSLLACIGCEYSQQPLYRNTELDTTLDHQLLGVWEDEDTDYGEQVLWMVERVAETNRYRITSRGEKDKSPPQAKDITEGYLAPIGDELIFDGWEFDHPNEHRFVRVRMIDENQMMLDIPNYNFLKRKPELLAHKAIRRQPASTGLLGRILWGPDKPTYELQYLTASTDELRDFFLHHSADVWKPQDPSETMSFRRITEEKQPMSKKKSRRR